MQQCGAAGRAAAAGAPRNESRFKASEGQPVLGAPCPLFPWRDRALDLSLECHLAEPRLILARAGAIPLRYVVGVVERVAIWGVGRPPPDDFALRPCTARGGHGSARRVVPTLARGGPAHITLARVLDLPRAAASREDRTGADQPISTAGWLCARGRSRLRLHERTKQSVEVSSVGST